MMSEDKTLARAEALWREIEWLLITEMTNMGGETSLPDADDPEWPRLMAILVKHLSGRDPGADGEA